MLLSKGRRFGGRGVSLVVATVVILALLGTVAYAAVRPGSDDVAKQFLQRSGRVRISNSRGNKALVGMQGMLPGDHTSGTVMIGNASRLRARFYLGLSRLVETQGAAGGRLSDRLMLTVKRLATNRRPQLVYTGPLRQMPLVKLGVFRPEATRTFRFSVLFPAGGASGDDRFQGASTSLQFSWYARRAR